MTDRSYLEWPFFEDGHRLLAGSVDSWAREQVPTMVAGNDEYRSCRQLVKALGDAGWLRYVVPASCGGPRDGLDVRSICLLRETLARYHSLADFAFAMQGLGGGPLTLFGSPDLKQRYLEPIGRGELIAAFALSEVNAGSDVAAIETTAHRDGNDWVLDGEKTWVSNAGIADVYVVFAKTGEGPGNRGLSAFVVESDTKGLELGERIEIISPHPLGTLILSECRVPATRRLGEGGDGFRVAMSTLDIFRSSVGAAAVGFARHAFAEALARVKTRRVFGRPLDKFQMTQASIADMAVEIDAAALLVYRAAWMMDLGSDRVTRETSMAKMYATEAAQRVIDRTVQLFGGLGVVKGNVGAELYCDIRPLRIYEGTTEIQKLIIAREFLNS